MRNRPLVNIYLIWIKAILASKVKNCISLVLVPILDKFLENFGFYNLDKFWFIFLDTLLSTNSFVLAILNDINKFSDMLAIFSNDLNTIAILLKLLIKYQ